MIRHLSQCQRSKVKGYHTTELFLSALGAYHIHIYKGIITYVRTEKEKETCHVGKYLYYLFLFECAKGKCVRIITFMCQQLSFVVSFLSWVNEKKQQLTGAIHACKCRQSYLIFIQKQTSKIIELKFQLTNIWGNCSYNHINTHSNMAENCTNYFAKKIVN
jgi:hypothetical protein